MATFGAFLTCVLKTVEVSVNIVGNTLSQFSQLSIFEKENYALRN